MKPIITLLTAGMTTAADEIASTVAEETTAIEETTTADTLNEVGAEITDNLNQAVENANKFVETLESYIPKIIGFGINLIIAVLIFAIGKIIINLLMKVINKFLQKSNIEISVQKFLDSLIKALLYFVLLIIICNQIGIQTTSFIALLSTAGLTIGLALQGSFSNFAGGILILLLKPFKVGDYIVDGSSGKEGTVQKIDLFYTMLVTVDNKLVTIPNGNLSNTHITNASAFDTRRVDLTIGINYDNDTGKAKEILRRLGENDPARLKEKPVDVYIKDLAASEVTLELRVWVNTGDYWDAYFRLKENMKKKLDDAGIEIPYQQLDVHIKEK
jgi:small conductance mechanosensitive channel